MPPKITVDQFAETVKKKYPQYNSVANDTLTRAILKKYPTYASQVDLDYQPMSTKPPENARFPAMGRTGYKIADFVTNALPGVGATIGGLQAETGPGAVALAAGGGVVGERAKHYLDRLIYKDLPKETLGEAATSMAVQGAMGAASEGGGRLVTGALDKLIPAFRGSAATLEGAKAGRGVRLTPGEVAGKPMAKLGETVLEHIPGGSGPMHAFREAQQSDVLNYLDQQLEQLSSQKLTAEQAGKRVQQVIRDAKAKSDLAVSAKFDDVRQMLGKKPGSYLSPEDFERALSEHEAAIGKKAGIKVTNSAARKRLLEARDLYRNEQAKFDSQILQKVIKTDKPELVGSYLESAGLEDLRRLKTVLSPAVQENAARNVFENIMNKAADPQSGVMNPRALSAGLKTLGEGRARLIFGAQYPSIVEATQLLNKINGSASSNMVGRMHAARIIASTSMALGGLAGFSLHGVAGAAETIGTEAMFSRLAAMALTKPALTAKALNILRTAAAVASRGLPETALNELFQPSPAIYREDPYSPGSFPPPLRFEGQP